jgi:hypothetical protein
VNRGTFHEREKEEGEEEEAEKEEAKEKKRKRERIADETAQANLVLKKLKIAKEIKKTLNLNIVSFRKNIF